MDIQKLKHLASEADLQVTWSLVPFDLHKEKWETDVVNYIGAISPATINDLINRLEKAEAQLAALARQEPDYTRYDCGACGHETFTAHYRNICPVCNHRPMKETGLFTHAAPPAPVVITDESLRAAVRIWNSAEFPSPDVYDAMRAAIVGSVAE